MAALSIHADYRCGQTGLCCTTPWDVPVEPAAFQAIEIARREGRLPVVQPFAGDAPPAGYLAVLRRDGDGACACLDGHTRLCTVHSLLGEPALPTACRLFPRIARTDAAGTVVTLSHYCPTAARMLLRDDVPLTVVEAPAAFPPGDYDGLVADDLPPLLHPRMLMGYNDYAAWETHAVSVCASAPTVWTALATLTRHAERLRTWQPGGATLQATLDAIAGDGAAPVASPPPVAWFEDRMREVMEAVPVHLQRSPLMERFRALNSWTDAVPSPDMPGPRHAPALRFLAAHALGNWCAYQGRGLRTYVRSLEAAAAVLTITVARQVEGPDRADDAVFIAAIRDADLLLRHLALSEALAEGWSRVETP